MAGEDNRAQKGPPEISGAPRASGPGSDRGFLLALLVIALILRAVTAWQSGVAAPQEIRYITIAEGMREGRGFNGIDARFPDVIQPPVYSLLLLLAMLPGFSSLAAARGVTALVGALLVFPLSALARRIFGDVAARRTAWLVAFYPLLVQISSISMTEPVFSLFVVLAVLCILRACGREQDSKDQNSDGREVLNISLAGLLLGLAFLTRPEGVADTIATSVLLFYWAWRFKKRPLSRSLLLALLPALVCVLVAAPYWVWIHGKTGRWLLAPKIALTRVHQEIMNRGVQEHWPEKYRSTLFFERVKFGLNDDGTDLLSAQAFRELGLVRGGEAVSDRSAKPAPSEAGYLADIVVKNLKQLYLDTIKYGLVLPTLLLGFLALGITSRPWRAGPDRYGQGILLWYALAGCSWILSYVQPRFLYPSIVFFLPWMAEGWTRTETWIFESLGVDRRSRNRLATRAIALGLLALVAASCLIHLPPAVTLFSSVWEEHKTAGEFLRSSGATPGSIMALTPVTSFYSRFPFEILPYADLDRVIAYARAKNVRYIEADTAGFRTYRPQLLPLCDPARAPAVLRPIVNLDPRSDTRLVLYEILPSEPARGEVSRPPMDPTP